MGGAVIVAYGAISALGVGEDAFTVGGVGAEPRLALGLRPGGKPFGRAEACAAERAERPRALLELAFAQVLEQLAQRDPAFRARRIGVIVGSSSGGMAALERARYRASPYFAPLAGLSALLGREPERLVALYGACASSALAIGLGLRWLELGRCDLVIAGGYDAESDWVAAGFDALKATSASTPRPFRSERDGMALGEGAALVALAANAASGIGYVRGFGATSDAVHITAPDRTGRGLARAAELALADAGAAASEVDFVSVHGTGTSFNDAAEAQALREVLGPRAEQVPLQVLKPCIGHTLGAAGALETLAALSAMVQGLLPASPAAGTAMPELAARLLSRNTPGKSELCLKLSTAFGGANSALVLATRASPPRARRRRVARLVAAGRFTTELDVARVTALLVTPPERLPRSDTLSALTIAAVAEALAAARAKGVTPAADRTGVIVGSVGATLEADAEFAARILSRGAAHAEPRRFPATSPNACAGHAAIAFGFRGVTHAVGAGPSAALEAVEVAVDWLEAGDVDTVFVVAAEHGGATATRALTAAAVRPPPQGALALVLSTASAEGPGLEATQIAHPDARTGLAAGNITPFAVFAELASAAGLPSPDAFGTVRAPE